MNDPAGFKEPLEDLLGSVKGTKTDAFLGHFERWAASSTAASECIQDIQDIRAAFATKPGEVADDLARTAAEFPGFSVEEKLGQGSFGAVYKAHDEKLMRHVALKVLLPQVGVDPTVQESFLNEARILAQIRHPNVLTIYTIETHGKRIALVTEFIRGETLDDLVDQNGPMGAEEAIQVGVKVCQALAAVHAAGLVHRDVKTANILRENGGRIVLSDFGLGIFLQEARQTTLAGTPLFMSPEQIDGRGVDHRSDLYALGVVLYWLVTREFPFVLSGQIQDLFDAKKSGRMVPMRDRRPDLPDRFVDVVQKSLRTDPEERFQTAGEMEDALIACLKSPSELFDSGQVATRPKPRAWSRRVAVASGALALAVLLMVVWLGRPGDPRVQSSIYRIDPLSGEHMPVDGDGEIRMPEPFGLSFQATDSRYVYLINATPGDDGFDDIQCLFPDPSKDLVNPLPPRGAPTDILGGEGIAVPRGGREILFVLASRTSIDGLQPRRERFLAQRGVRTVTLPYDVDTALGAVVEKLEKIETGEVVDGDWWFKKYVVVNP